MLSFHSINFSGQKVFVRVDFNVPLNEQFKVTDTNRMVSALPTIQKIIQDGGSIILASHLGRPKGKVNPSFSMKHILPALQQLLPNITIHLAQDCIGSSANALCQNLQSGEIVLLENLRFHSEEEAGDEAFAKALAALADFYVNDAFGTAHRAHASTAIMAHFFDNNHKSFGALMEKEVLNAENVMNSTAKPFCAILGGAKVSDKILIIEHLISKADHIIVGGGMAYTFLKALGHTIGDSIVELDLMPKTLTMLEAAKKTGCTIHLPIDFIIADTFSNAANTQQHHTRDIPDGWQGLDCGERSILAFSAVIAGSKKILWNGPMGVFEMEKFRNGTIAIAEAVSKATSQGAFSLVGGGDSVAAVQQFGFSDKVSYISTGGGALLEFFEGKNLPGIAAIRM